jgi:hypothetical protein
LFNSLKERGLQVLAEKPKGVFLQNAGVNVGFSQPISFLEMPNVLIRDTPTDPVMLSGDPKKCKCQVILATVSLTK